MRQIRRIGGAFYPLDVRRALDMDLAPAYLERCAERARRAALDDAAKGRTGSGRGVRRRRTRQRPMGP